jgi:hypothetical protein
MTRFLIGMLLCGLVTTPSGAQLVNWRRVDRGSPRLVNASAGVEFGATAGLSFGQRIPGRRSVLLGTEFSAPAGRNVVDDFVVRQGLQAEILHHGDLSATIRWYGTYGRLDMALVRINSFGSDLGMVAGYASRRWQLGAEVDFRKAIATHVRHKQDVGGAASPLVSGWYVPTGGNLLYGIRSGVHLGRAALMVRGGGIVTQAFTARLTVPVYASVALGFHL